MIYGRCVCVSRCVCDSRMVPAGSGTGRGGGRGASALRASGSCILLDITWILLLAYRGGELHSFFGPTRDRPASPMAAALAPALSTAVVSVAQMRSGRLLP